MQRIKKTEIPLIEKNHKVFYHNENNIYLFIRADYENETVILWDVELQIHCEVDFNRFVEKYRTKKKIPLKTQK